MLTPSPICPVLHTFCLQNRHHDIHNDASCYLLTTLHFCFFALSGPPPSNASTEVERTVEVPFLREIAPSHNLPYMHDARSRLSGVRDACERRGPLSLRRDVSTADRAFPLRKSYPDRYRGQSLSPQPQRRRCLKNL